MVTRRLQLLALAGLLTSGLAKAEEPSPVPATPVAAAAAPAEATAGAPAPQPLPRGELHHAPVSFARIREPIIVRATIDHPELVTRAVLVYGEPGGELTELVLERAPDGPYVAVIPADRVKPPAVGYAIELEDVGGARRPVFAKRAALHRVEVAQERIDSRELAFLARLDGRRSVIGTQADYVSFGESRGTVAEGTPQQRTLEVSDRYFRIEGSYTYRLLRTVSEFGIRVGVVRGRSPVDGAKDPGDFDVGLNYASPKVQFRLVDAVHLDLHLLTSLTEQGFSGGAGGGIHIGDVLGSQLVLAVESISVFGTRAYSRVDVAAAPRVIVSAQVEGTNMPHANRPGVRLLGEVGVDLGAGFRVVGRGGYQARDSASGGFAAGLGASYAF